MIDTTQDTWQTLLVGEMLLYSLLGKVLYSEPDKDLLESFIREDVFSEAPFGSDQPEIQKGLDLLRRWARENASGLGEQEFKALSEDHLRLFIGLEKVLAPVWESVYFSKKRLVFQEQTLQVRQWYARFGLQAERLHQEPDDHIGLELSFVAHLARLAAQALEQGDQAGFDQGLQAQRDFLSEHLLCWGPAWCRLVETHAQTSFYHSLAHLTHGALLAAAELLQVELPGEVSI